jgi:hypothetical protein
MSNNTGFIVNNGNYTNKDLIRIFAPYTSGTQASATGFIVNNVFYSNKDLNTILAPYTSGTKASATGYYCQLADLNTIFAPNSLVTYINFNVEYNNARNVWVSGDGTKNFANIATGSPTTLYYPLNSIYTYAYQSSSPFQSFTSVFSSALYQKGSNYRNISTYIFPENTGLSWTFWINPISQSPYTLGGIFGYSTTSDTQMVALRLISKAASTPGTNSYLNALTPPWYLNSLVDGNNSGSATTGGTIINAYEILANNWTHVAWTISPAAYGSTTATHKFYFNGTLRQEVINANYPQNYARTLNDIGGQHNNSSNESYIDTFRFYTKELNSTDINYIYNTADPNNIVDIYLPRYTAPSPAPIIHYIFNSGYLKDNNYLQNVATGVYDLNLQTSYLSIQATKNCLVITNTTQASVISTNAININTNTIFNGSTNYIGLTINMWFKRNAVMYNPFQDIWGWWDNISLMISGSSKGSMILYGLNGGLRILFNGGGYDFESNVIAYLNRSDAGAISSDVFHMLTFVFRDNSTTNKLECSIYFNASFNQTMYTYDANADGTGKNNNFTNTMADYINITKTHMTFGYTLGSNKPFEGSIADFRMYSSQLSASQITAIYNAGISNS